MTNRDLLYTFQDLTDDGSYYVTAVFPVTTSILPDTVEVNDWEAFEAGFPTYLAETKAALTELTPLDFTPDLALLDAVVVSLQVETDVELSGVETAVAKGNRSRTSERLLLAELDSRRIILSE